MLACIESAPLPDVGPCAVYPDGVYEYGEIGIGTCLAGPTRVEFLDDTRLAIANSNPWLDFRSGSLSVLDISALDLSIPRNLISDLGAQAVELPSLIADFDRWGDTLLIGSRNSVTARTRVADDFVLEVDISGETPVLGDSVVVGSDPNALWVDDAGQRAYVINRTDHTVSVLEGGPGALTVVDPAADPRIEPWTFVDDGDGSKAEFVVLGALEDTEPLSPVAHTWRLSWRIGQVRVFVPGEEGLYRLTGNGADTWDRSAIPAEISLEDDNLPALADPFIWEDGAGNQSVVFADGTGIRVAVSDPNELDGWTVGEDALLLPSADWDQAVGGPSLVTDAGIWHLFYDGNAGGAGAIGVATSVDGVTFERESTTPLFQVDGASLSDPFVLWDEQSERWRLYCVVDRDEVTTLAEAWSDDLLTWSELLESGPEAITGPAITHYNGNFHLFFTRYGAASWELIEAVSVDGSDWTELGAVQAIELADPALLPRVGLSATAEEAFRMEDEAGNVAATSVPGGLRVQNIDSGWELQVATGFWLGAEDGTNGIGGVQPGSLSPDGTRLYVTEQDADGVTRVGVSTVADGGMVISALASPAPGEAGRFDEDGVSDPVVVSFGGQWVMYYAGSAGGRTTVGRATSSDGLTWTADAAPVLTSTADWDAVSLVPGSVVEGADGVLTLWFSAFDGELWRIGAATSTDGTRFTRVSGDTYAWIFDEGGPGEWFDSGVRDPVVLRDAEDAELEHLWFSGFDGDFWRIGYASRRSGGDFEPSLDREGTPRPILRGGRAFGVEGVIRPVVAAVDGGWELWYAGFDDSVTRIGRARLSDPDRAYRWDRMPSLADLWGFTAIPGLDQDHIDLYSDLSPYLPLGCSGLVGDPGRGLLYVLCKLSGDMMVIDTRDDTDSTLVDLNFLALEAVGAVATTSTIGVVGASTGSYGLRGGVYDAARDRMWAVGGGPEALFGVDVSRFEDDDSLERVDELAVSMLPLPRDAARDRGEPTQASLGPGGVTMHPDGRHLFITNFNDNSVTVVDLELGPAGAVIAELSDMDENPYTIAFTPDGTLAVVACYAGEATEIQAASTLVVLDSDPTSPGFGQVLTRVVNQ